jgi:hypothetical protein
MMPPLLFAVGLLITALAVVLVFRKARIADITICSGIGVILIALGIGLSSGSPIQSLRLAGVSINFYPVQPLATPAGKGAATGAAEAPISPRSPDQPPQTTPSEGAAAGASGATATPRQSLVRPLQTEIGNGDPAGERGEGTLERNGHRNPMQDMALVAQARGEQDWRQTLRSLGFIPLVLPEDTFGPGSVVYDRLGALPPPPRDVGAGLDTYYEGTDAFVHLKVSDQAFTVPIPRTLALNGIDVDCSSPSIKRTTIPDLKSAAQKQSLEKLASSAQAEGTTLYVILSSLSCAYRGRRETIAVELVSFSLTGRTSLK